MEKLWVVFIWVPFALVLGNGLTAKAQERPPVLPLRQVAPVPPGTPTTPVPPLPPPAGTPPAPGNPPAPSASTEVPPPPFSPGTGNVTPPNLATVAHAIQTARQVKKYLTAGSVWAERAPAGEVVLKAALVYDNVAVGALEFNPTDGSVLPCGFHPRVFSGTPALQAVKEKLPALLAHMTVLEGAEFREPENCWVVPLAIQGAIVSHIKIYADGTYVVPDYPITQEMQALGR